MLVRLLFVDTNLTIETHATHTHSPPIADTLVCVIQLHSKLDWTELDFEF